MYQKTVLDNGLRIVTHDMPERDSISLGIWVGVGGRYEDDRLKGAAHFLEHVVFKGSQKYSCNEIKELIEGVGGTLNAFTSEEQTCYYAKIPSKHLKRTFDILADISFYPQLSAKDVAKEKTVIIEEIKMYHDLPQYFVSDLLDQLLWPNHPLGRNLIGTAESVGAMTVPELRSFFDSHYAPNNTVVAACGGVRHEHMVELVKRKLEKAPVKEKRGYAAACNIQKHPRSKLFSKKIEQMHLALGALGYDEHNDDRYVLSLIAVILGGNMSSRLFNEVREKRGLAYSITSASKSLHDTGLFLIRAGVDNEKIVKSLELILKELDKIKRLGVQKSELTRSKDYLIGQSALALEDTMDHMLWIGESTLVKDRMITLDEIIKKIETITRDDISRVAQEILSPKRFNLAVVGPLTTVQEKELNELMKAA